MSKPEPTILVTGANGGLGRAIAECFLHEWPQSFIYMGFRHRRDHIDQLMQRYPERTEAIPLEVTQKKAWEEAIDHIHSQERNVTVLVNNAGHHEDHLLANMPDSAWSEVIDSNLNSAYFGSKAVIPSMMKTRFGRIINISSLSAIMAPVGQTNYSAAKAGLIAMSQSLAKEVIRFGITVNAICPGYIETEALSHLDDEKAKSLKKSIPARRFGKPSEVASAAIFLANETSGYITGSCLKIDGGIF